MLSEILTIKKSVEHHPKRILSSPNRSRKAESLLSQDSPRIKFPILKFDSELFKSFLYQTKKNPETNRSPKKTSFKRVEKKIPTVNLVNFLDLTKNDKKNKGFYTEKVMKRRNFSVDYSNYEKCSQEYEFVNEIFGKEVSELFWENDKKLKGNIFHKLGERYTKKPIFDMEF